jgi:hypothetical protein
MNIKCKGYKQAVKDAKLIHGKMCADFLKALLK